MYLTTLVGVAFGEVARRNDAVKDLGFPLAAIASILCLVLAAFRRDDPVRHLIAVGLAAIATFILMTQTCPYADVSYVITQIFGLLPFLLGLCFFVRCDAWLAAIGAGGFFATLVGMLLNNSHGGHTSFFYIHSH